MSFFSGYDRSWNLFDALVVVSMLGDVISRMAENRRGFSRFGLLRIFKLIGVLRLVQFLRVLKEFSEFYVFVGTLRRAMRGLFWLALVLLFFLYSASVSLTQGTIGLCYDSASAPEVCRHFGSLNRSMLSLNAAIWGGSDWRVLLESLSVLS